MLTLCPRRAGAICWLALLLAARPTLAGDDDFPKVNWGLLGDARAVATDDTVSWLDEGLGKTRYGASDDGDARRLLRLSQASATLSVFFTDEISTKLHVNVDADPSSRYDGKAIDYLDVVEANFSYRPVLSPHVRLATRFGLVFPFTVENDGKAWTATRTITASAANSWIGEEVRPTAAEIGVILSPEGHEISLTGAAFVANDPAGTLLAWRGWALHDRLTGIHDEIPLAPIPSVEEGGIFARQARWDMPIKELDGRIGWYARASWVYGNRFDLRAFYYDNRGDPLRFDGNQYAWDTRFKNLAAIVPAGPHVELIGQWMAGHTEMGPRAAVLDFDTESLLATAFWGRHRVTVRYEEFSTTDLDRFQLEDDNDEEGKAWTAAYILETGEKHRLAFELLRVESDRDERAAIGLPIHAEELTAQLSFRIWY